MLGMLSSIYDFFTFAGMLIDTFVRKLCNMSAMFPLIILFLHVFCSMCLHKGRASKNVYRHVKKVEG